MPDPAINSNEIPVKYHHVIASNVYQAIEDDFSADDQYSPESYITIPQYPTILNSYYIDTSVVYQGTSAIPTLSGSTPNTQTDLLDSVEENVQELILQVKRSLFIRHYKSLADNLLSLYYFAKEEDPESIGIAPKSLQNFINFIQLHNNLKCPIISLTPEYNIYASWRSEKRRVFSVHFLPNDDVRFVIFRPNVRHPGRMIRISGTATNDTLIETVMPFRLDEWITE